MEMARDALSATNCLLYFLIILVLLHNCDSLGNAGGDVLPLGASLTGNQTLISQNGTFKLGFFCPSGTNNWYLGIWYAQISDKTIVWVANRETPIKNMPGILKLSTDGYLTVSGLEGKAVWSSDNSQQSKASRASILDSGNFVVLGAQNTSEIVWESFRHPGDTLLPGMKFWQDMNLISWKSSKDPAPGSFVLEKDASPGTTDHHLRHKNGVSYWTSGEWNGKYFTNFPEALEALNKLGVEYKYVQVSPSRMYTIYWVVPNTQIMSVREVLSKNGELLLYFFINNSGWSIAKSSPQYECTVYGVCGAYGVCNNNSNIQSCSCLQGFRSPDDRALNSDEWSSSGCVRRSPLNCSVANSTTDGFLQISNKSLSAEKAMEYSQESSLQGCRTACLNNCSCTAFAITNSNPPVCRLWFGDLLNMHDTSDGQPFFIRLAASDLLQSSSNGGGRGRVLALSISLTLGVVVMAFLFALFIQRRRGRLLHKYKEDDMPASLRTFTYKDLQTATNNFTHKLGSGAFGSVFKGSLSNSTLVAVKKLENSIGGEKPFRAEISTIGNIQHVNLVRLSGFCAEGSQRLLAYEYMPNGSLNSFLSRKSEGVRMVLDWKTRYDIALGTARGLVYLHEECIDRIIHCDIKPENILLDGDLNPKLADFGLSKLVGRDFSSVLTTTRGTRGYLAPEWISGLPITPKVDVYSFGMTLLEIISGRRNIDLSEQESRCYFPTWAATQIEKGNMMGLVDERIANNANVEQVRRAVVVSILCIQHDENVRPSMAEVVLMLEGKIEADAKQIERSVKVLVDEYV